MTTATSEERLAVPRLLEPALRAPAPPLHLKRRKPFSATAIVGWVMVLAVLAAAVFADVLAPVSPWTTVGTPFQPPSLVHPLGTDDLGRSLLSGIIHGARTSLIVSLTAASLSAAIGILLGALSGYFGGTLDDALMRLTEFFQVIPRFFLALVAVALFEPGLLTITLVLGLTSWPMTARLLHRQVLSAREREYVVAARAVGADRISILRRHILPNTLAPVIVHTTLMIGQVMLTEASLAFLGLGDPNHISWGYLLSNAQPFLRTAWWMAAFPGLALALAVVGLNLLGDDLTELPL